MVVKSDRYKENDFILKTDTAIIVTSHPGHIMFLKATLENYMKTGKYVILSYDSHNDWPPEYVMNIPHTIVTKPETFGAEVRIGWLYDVILAAGLIRPLNNIEAVIITNGDCIWERPENVDALKGYVNRHAGDMMCVTADSVLHTAAMIMKGWIFQEFVEYCVEHMRNNIPESYSPEVLLRDFVKEKNIKNVVPEIQPLFPEGHQHVGKVDHYASYKQDSTWKKLVGFRNLGGEMKVNCHEHLEPVDKKYFNILHDGIYLSQHERDTLYMYFRTNDRRWLYKYWDTGEMSSFNRRYFDLEYYGPKPLYDDLQREKYGPYSERSGFFDRFKCDSYIIKDKEFEKQHKKFIQERYPDLL
jgi:hypothetical protein